MRILQNVSKKIDLDYVSELLHESNLFAEKLNLCEHYAQKGQWSYIYMGRINVYRQNHILPQKYD